METSTQTPSISEFKATRPDNFNFAREISVESQL